MLAFSSRKNKSNRGGGSVQQPLDYLDTSYPKPDAPAGKDLLIEQGGVARPMIGGFTPSIMKGVVNAGTYLGPLAAVEAKRLWNGNSTRKRRGGGKRENWARNRTAARIKLEQYGKPSALNINRFAALLRKDPEAARAFLAEYQYRKQQPKGSRKATPVRARTIRVNEARAPQPLRRSQRRVMFNSLGPKAFRHLFLNEDDNILAEERVFPGIPLRLTVNKTGRVLNETKTRKAATLKPAIRPTAQFAPLPVIPESVSSAANAASTSKYTMVNMPATAATTRRTRAQYKENLATARRELAQYGRANVANASKYLRLKTLGKNTNMSAFLNNFKTRKAAVKTPAKAPKTATVVTETPRMTLRPRTQAKYVPLGMSGEKAKRTRKVSNAWKTFYAQAKQNLTAFGKAPKAQQITSLAALRKKGENNTAFMTAYKNRLNK